MARYYDMDKLSEMIEERADQLIEGKEAFLYIAKWLNLLPSADVVEVVRCKDCDVPHNKWTGCPNLNGLIPPSDFYCAKGTPKERGGEK